MGLVWLFVYIPVLHHPANINKYFFFILGNFHAQRTSFKIRKQITNNLCIFTCSHTYLFIFLFWIKCCCVFVCYFFFPATMCTYIYLCVCFFIYIYCLFFYFRTVHSFIFNFTLLIPPSPPSYYIHVKVNDKSYEVILWQFTVYTCGVPVFACIALSGLVHVLSSFEFQFEIQCRFATALLLALSYRWRLWIILLYSVTCSIDHMYIKTTCL